MVTGQFQALLNIYCLLTCSLSPVVGCWHACRSQIVMRVANTCMYSEFSARSRVPNEDPFSN